VTTIEQAELYMQDQMERALAFTANEVRGALLVLALAAREDYPDATHIVLGESDQGRWMWVEYLMVAGEGDAVDMAIEGSEDWDEQETGASSHLYDNMRDVIEEYAPHGDSVARRSGEWLLDIDKVITEIAPTLEV